MLIIRHTFLTEDMWEKRVKKLSLLLVVLLSSMSMAFATTDVIVGPFADVHAGPNGTVVDVLGGLVHVDTGRHHGTVVDVNGPRRGVHVGSNPHRTDVEVIGRRGEVVVGSDRHDTDVFVGVRPNRRHYVGVEGHRPNMHREFHRRVERHREVNRCVRFSWRCRKRKREGHVVRERNVYVSNVRRRPAIVKRHRRGFGLRVGVSVGAAVWR